MGLFFGFVLGGEWISMSLYGICFMDFHLDF